MRLPIAGLLALLAQLPSPAAAQRSPGRGAEARRNVAAQVPGVATRTGSRQVEVLVVYYGFSPAEIPATQGEEITLRLRRSDEKRCRGGLSVPTKEAPVQLPIGEDVLVTLKLEKAETLALKCVGDDTAATIVVAPGKPAAK